MSAAEHPDVIAAAQDRSWLEDNRVADEAIDEFWTNQGWDEVACRNECGHCFNCGAVWAKSWIGALLSNKGLLVMSRLKVTEANLAASRTTPAPTSEPKGAGE